MRRPSSLPPVLLALAACAEAVGDDVMAGDPGPEVAADAGAAAPAAVAPDAAPPLPSVAADAGAADGRADGGDEDAGAADAALPPAYAHYDVNQVLETGASDAVANGGSPYLTKTQPFENLMFDVGVFTGANPPRAYCDGYGCKGYQTPTALVPLVEGDTFIDADGVETIASGFANQATVFATAWLARVGLPARGHAILVSNHGRSGTAYDCLRKGSCDDLRAGYTRPFEEGLRQVTDARALALAAGKTHVVRAVAVIHGQSDSDDGEYGLSHYVYRTDGSGELVGNYTNALLEWQHDYESEIRKVTGQTEPVPMFVSQFGSFTEYAHSVIPQRQLDAHVAAPGKVVVVTPNYPFRQDGDCNHYVPSEQRRLGAYFARAYQRVVVEGGVYEPTRPRTITRSGATVTIAYRVPVPPLVLDTERVVDPGAYGFVWEDDARSATITDVRLDGPDTITITLSAVPTGAHPVLHYASYVVPGEACPGPQHGARGNVRDSDATPAYYADGAGKPYELFNWSVQFDLPVE